eukprot:4772652-Amphidinium_carterae.1
MSSACDMETGYAAPICRRTEQYPIYFQAVIGTFYGLHSNGLDTKRVKDLRPVSRWAIPRC